VIVNRKEVRNGNMKKIYLTIRAISFYILLAISVLVCVTCLFLSWRPGSFKSRFTAIRLWSKTAAWLGKVICGIDYEIRGLENLPAEPAVYLSRHESAWETLVLPGVLPMNCCICKKSLQYIPVFGWAFAMAKHIPIDRSQGVKAFKRVLKLGKERVKFGLSILIYPEGTRVAPGEFPKFHKTGVSLARAAGVKVVPIAHDAGRLWRKNSFLKYPGKVTISIGEPIDTKGADVNKVNEAVHAWIKQTLS